jgi:hypothetical protein
MSSRMSSEDESMASEGSNGRAATLTGIDAFGSRVGFAAGSSRLVRVDNVHHMPFASGVVDGT